MSEDDYLACVSQQAAHSAASQSLPRFASDQGRAFIPGLVRIAGLFVEFPRLLGLCLPGSRDLEAHVVSKPSLTNRELLEVAFRELLEVLDVL